MGDRQTLGSSHREHRVLPTKPGHLGGVLTLLRSLLPLSVLSIPGCGEEGEAEDRRQAELFEVPPCSQEASCMVFAHQAPQ